MKLPFIIIGKTVTGGSPLVGGVQIRSLLDMFEFEMPITHPNVGVR